MEGITELEAVLDCLEQEQKAGGMTEPRRKAARTPVGEHDVANVIVLESTLSYLGFGIQPPTASWGNMLANSQENITIAWWAAVYPGLCIFVTVLAINYMGDGLRDALDPNVR